MTHKLTICTQSLIMMLALLFTAQSCKDLNNKKTIVAPDKPEYFNLRPKLEKEYGYTHAVKLVMILKFPGL